MTATTIAATPVLPAKQETVPVRLVWLWAVLLILRAVALFTGLERLPLLPSAPPEVMINDPAVALSRGYGLVGLSFEHSPHGLDVLYANFPPLYIALQAVVFRVFGFSAAALRVPVVLADLAACGILLAIFLDLYRRNIIDRVGFALGGAVLLLEPTTLIHDRSGRMEAVCVVFGCLALYLCIRGDATRNWSKPLHACAGIAAGLAMATHFGALVIWAAVVVWSAGWVWHQRSVKTLTAWMALNAIPLLVLLCALAAAWGVHSGEAFQELRQLSRYAPKSSLSFDEVVSSVKAHAPGVAVQAGGPALLLIFAALALGIWRLATSWNSRLFRLLLIVVLQCALIKFFVPGPGYTRIVMVVPFAALCLALALSHLPAGSRKGLIAATAAFCIFQFALTAGYVGELRHGWAGRSPERFDALVNSIPADARVVAVPEFWYAFLSHNRRMALIYHPDDEYKYWTDTPGAFDPYDFVILDPQSPDYPALHAKAQASHPFEHRLKSYGREFTVDQRRQTWQ